MLTPCLSLRGSTAAKGHCHPLPLSTDRRADAAGSQPAGTAMAQEESKFLGSCNTFLSGMEVIMTSCNCWFSSCKFLFIPDLLIFILSALVLIAQCLGKNRSIVTYLHESPLHPKKATKAASCSAKFVLMLLLQTLLAAPTAIIPYLTGVLIRRLNTWQVLVIQSMVCTKNTYLYALLFKTEQLIL